MILSIGQQVPINLFNTIINSVGVYTMAVSFSVVPEPEEIQEEKKSVGRPKGSTNKPKPVTAAKETKYSSTNPHPDKGTYIKIPVGQVTLDGNLYLGVANTGGMGVTNIRFILENVDLGDGIKRNLTVHSGWGNILVERTPEEIQAMGLLGKKSGLQVHELPGYILEDGVSNIEEILGEKRKKD